MNRINIQLEIPETGSPVPALCSVHAEPGRGRYGNSKYRGNCSGLLIRDLLSFYQPERLLDPMEGSGTSRAVAKELHLDYFGFDLKQGLDATEPGSFKQIGSFDFGWIHPPYYDLVKYNGEDLRCLSNSKTVTDFNLRLQRVIVNCLSVLKPGGHIAVLIGDITRKGKFYGLPFHLWMTAKNIGLELAAPEICRLSHGASSSKRVYSHSFIPRVHDVCLVFRRIRNEM